MASLVDFVLADPKASKYHLGGFERLSPDLKQFMVVCGMTGYISEGFLAECLEDARIPQKTAALEDLIEEEMAWIDGLDETAWQFLGSACDLAPGDVRSQVLAACHVSIGVLTNRVLKPAKQLPWSLVQGDIMANLATLVEMEEPDEPVSRKIWKLLRMGFNREEIHQGLSLLAGCPWSSTGVEQQHGSASTIMKLRSELGSDTMCCRALVHSPRALCSQGQASKRVAHLEQLLQTLRAKKPGKCGPRQMYVKQLINLASRWQAQGRQLPTDARQKIMKKHADRFRELPPSAVANLSAEAMETSERKAQALADQVEEVQGQLALETRRQAEEQLEHRGRMLLSTCRFTEGDFKALEKLWSSKEFQNKAV